MVLLTFLRHFNNIFSEKSMLPENLLSSVTYVVRVQYVPISQLAV